LHLACEQDDLGSIPSFEFLHDVPDVHLHCALGHLELIGDYLIRFTLLEVLQHMTLTWGEVDCVTFTVD